MKKKIIGIIVCMLLIASPVLSATMSSNNKINMDGDLKPYKQQGIADISPNIDPITPSVGLAPSQLTLSRQGNNPQLLDMWDLLFSFDVEEASGAAGNTGAHCFGDYLYTSRWASNIQHQYDLEGTMLKQFSVGGVSGVRDLAYDGDYLYGGPASGTIWGWDPIGETLESTITGGFQTRACAYNDDDDTFFVSNWGDPVWEVNRDGDILDSFNLALTTSTYGFAYDQWSDGGPFLWVFDQGGSGAEIKQWDLAQGEFTDVEHDVTEDFPGVTAGGLFFTEEYEAGEALLGGLGQGSNDPMFVYGGYCPPPMHDVAMKNIISPENGYAGEDMEVIVQVINVGNNTEEDIPVNVVILKDGVDEEYNETEYIDVINAGETVDVEMPAWTPNDWQSASNEYIDYKINASTVWKYDENPSNDYKEKWFELYFGYFHDVGCTDVSGPETGPAQTFPVNGHIKNFGQYDECCFKTYMEIAELDIENQVELLTQDFSDDTFPPTGWAKTHDNWMYGYSSYAGGSSGEARFYYSPESTDLFRLYTFAIDTSNYDAIEIEFKQYVNHNTTPYTLQVETSDDGVNWDVVWDINPSGNVGPETVTILTIKNAGLTTYVSWTFNGVSGNIDNWYVDGIIINGYFLLDPEYEENQCITTIDPGEEVELDFDDWTPEFLAEETTDTKKYIVKCWTELEDPEDENPDNDALVKSVKLNYWHDVGIREITSPDDAGRGKWLLWDNGDTDGSNGYSLLGSPRRSLLDDFELTKSSKISEYRCYMIWPSSHATDWETTFWTDDNGEPGEKIVTATTLSFSEVATGRVWFGYPEYEVFYEFEPIFLSKGTYWVEGWITASTPNSYQMIRLDMWGSQCWANYEDYGFVPGYNVFGVQADLSYQLRGHGCWPPRPVYVALGSQNIETIVENIGTFPELDLTCYAKIYEYITNCTNGTLVYEDNITNIDLDVPLGGTETLNFDSYNFYTEGIFGLFLNMSDDDDDYPKNNEFVLLIGADDTPPGSSHSLVPATPDGENGWYVSDVEVTLDATDPEIGCVTGGSGVMEIKYKIGSGSWQTIDQPIPGSPTLSGTFIIDVDADDLPIEYYAVDYVGNEESTNSFTIDIDQTVPDIEEIMWEAFQDPPIYGLWYVTFTCDAVDATSGMDRVEMFINKGFCEEIVGAGPTYEFTIEWSSILKTVVFTFEHYNVAGNMIADDLAGDEPVSYANYKQQQQYPASRSRTTYQYNNRMKGTNTPFLFPFSHID